MTDHLERLSTRTRFEDLRVTLLKRRLTLGWSQREAAAKMGVTQGAFAMLENGSNLNPNFDTLYRWARSLKMRLLIDAEPADD